MIGALIIVVPVSLATALLPSSYSWLGILIGLGSLFWLMRLLRRRSRRILTVSPLRAGVTTITFEEDGFRQSNDAYESFTRWRYLYDALATPQALLILFTQHEYYPIEAAAFDSPDHMEQVAADIRIRIAANRRL